jgi:hypothetical protein
MFLVLSGVSLTLLLAAGTGVLRLPGIDLWYWDRFRGWSQNPNQLAELCLVAALVGLYLADIAVRARDRFVALLCIIPAVWVGRIAQTDAFSYGLVFALLMFLGMKLYEWITTPGPRASLVALTLFVFPLLLVAALPVVISALSEVGSEAVTVLSKEGGKDAQAEADLRFAVWKEALARGFQVRMLGLGPGPHLPIPPEIVTAIAGSSVADRPAAVTSPPQGAADDFEAHNTMLDLFVQGGLIASLAYLWLMFCAVMSALRSRSAGLTSLICGLNLFASVGFAIRLPLFWFAVALCLVARRETLAFRHQVLVRERNR